MNVNPPPETSPAQTPLQHFQAQSQEAQFMGNRVSDPEIKSLIGALTKQTLNDRCMLCRNVRDVRDRKVSSLPIILSKRTPLYHKACSESLMNKALPHSEQDQQSSLRISGTPSPLFAPEWDGDEFVCKIQKSELERQAPYVGVPMTFSFDDRPDVTVALGFKGIPWIFCSNPEDSQETRQDVLRLTIVYRYFMQSTLYTLPPDMDREMSRELSLQWLKFDLSSFIDFSSNLPDNLKDFLKNPENFPDSLEMYFDPLGDIHAVNPPMRPFMWCEPVQQGAKKVPVAVGEANVVVRHADGKRRNPEDMDDAVASKISARQNHPFPCGNVDVDKGSAPRVDTPCQDDLSFQLRVTDPEDNKTYAQLGGLTFKEGESSVGIFSNGATVADFSGQQRIEYMHFAKNFNYALETMASNELLTIRIKPEIGAVIRKPEQSFESYLKNQLSTHSADSDSKKIMATFVDRFRGRDGEILPWFFNAFINGVRQTIYTPDHGLAEELSSPMNQDRPS